MSSENALADVRVPQVLWGRRCEPTAQANVAMPIGEAALPELTAHDIDQVLAQDRMLLADVPLQEIVAFLNRAGRNWKSTGYVRRRLYVTHLQRFLGYSELAAEAEADRIAALLSAHSRAYDLLDAELGSHFAVDEWVRREDSWIRAIPRGLVAHILPGNVPLANVVSVVRALLTKNISVVKLPTRDPFTGGALALSLIDVDENHPVARALTCVWWRHDDSLAQEMVNACDAVVAWGGEEALRWAHDACAADAAFTAFGPKRSLALVTAGADMKRAARGVAHDASVYDQHACFSTQQVFIDTNADEFCEHLAGELSRHATLLPPGRLSLDEAAIVNLARHEEECLGSEVVCADDLAWTIIRSKADVVREHPQCRTVFVHEVADLAEVYSFVGPEVQTVSGAPWSVLTEHRDALSARGVTRLCEVGLSNLFRVGGTHDGVNPLQGLVRLVSMDAPADMHGKGMVRRLDQTEFLQAGDLKELIL